MMGYELHYYIRYASSFTSRRGVARDDRARRGFRWSGGRRRAAGTPRRRRRPRPRRRRLGASRGVWTRWRGRRRSLRRPRRRPRRRRAFRRAAGAAVRRRRLKVTILSTRSLAAVAGRASAVAGAEPQAVHPPLFLQTRPPRRVVVEHLPRSVPRRRAFVLGVYAHAAVPPAHVFVARENVLRGKTHAHLRY